MDRAVRRRGASRWGVPAVAFLAAALLGAGSAQAIVIPLTVEFDAGTAGNFGTVEVTQNGDDLDFQIVLGPDLNLLGGGAPDLHELYFNLVDAVTSFTNLAIVADDAPNSPYTLLGAGGGGVAVSGGAGSSFDLAVNFGNGAGPPGNGVLSQAFFRLSADQALTLADLSETSNPNSVDPSVLPINFAIHVQGTAFVAGETSETVGGGAPNGVIPEPSTLALVVAGLTGLVHMGARRRR